jgi:hypothetical protein
MSMLFDIAGPFDLKRFGSKKILTDETSNTLKPELDHWHHGLSEACGCYVFGVRAGKGVTPYYVGQACKTSILKEALNPSNVGKYNKVLSDRAGTPVIFFIPMKTPAGKFRKRKKVGGGLAALDFLEEWLIGMAIQKNATLINNKKTFFLRNIRVTGFFNARQGEATTASQRLVKALE